MLRIYRFMLSVLFASFAVTACMTDSAVGPATDLVPIRSASDLDNYLLTARNSPLDRMSPDARQGFLDSLTFTKNGLGGYRYTDLQELPDTDIHDVLRLFDAEDTAGIVTGTAPAKDPNGRLLFGCPFEGYRCAGAGSCNSEINYICMCTCVAP